MIPKTLRLAQFSGQATIEAPDVGHLEYLITLLQTDLIGSILRFTVE